MINIIQETFVYWSFHHKNKTIIVIVISMLLNFIFEIIGLQLVSMDILFIIQTLVLLDSVISVILYLDKSDYSPSKHCFFTEVTRTFFIGLCKGITLLIIYLLILFLKHMTLYTGINFDFSYLLAPIACVYIAFILDNIASISFIKKIFGKYIKTLSKYSSKYSK